MLPKTKHSPAFTREALVGVAIPSPVALDLRPPPGGVRLRPRAVLRTPVPKAAVHEHSDPRAQERDVSAAARPWQRGVNAITHAKRTQGRTERELARRVPLTRDLHAMAHVVG